MVNPSDQIQELHKTYCMMSRMDLSMRFDRERSWAEFLHAGFTKADLIAVLDRLHRLVLEGDRRPEALKFSNSIQALDRFEEELAMVKAEAVGFKPVERQLSVMELQRIYDAKTAVAEDIARKHAHHDGFAYVFENEEYRKQHVALRHEMKAILEKIAKVNVE